METALTFDCTPRFVHFEYKFTGKERDTESGLDYFGARYYASNMGRWMSPDWADKPEAVPYSSLNDPQSLNLYSYVGDNPLSRADADGHEPIEIGIGVYIGVRAVGGILARLGGALLAGGALGALTHSPAGGPINLPGRAGLSPGFLAQQAAAAKSDKAPPNPDGQKGAPDHQAAVQEEADKARAAAGPGETVTQGTKIQVEGSTRRPDVQTVGADGRTKSVVEVERRPNSARNQTREAEYNKLGVQHTTRPLPPKNQ